MSIYPDFYERFCCLAGACRHSCCRGWEIDVDEQSAAFYEALPGSLGDQLRRSIEHGDEGAHFLLTADGRCPFLRGDGLCELILKLGEDALCDICALHPRFYEDVGETELCGLGLSCEAVCALLLERKAPLRFLDDESGEAFEFARLLSRLGFPAQEQALAYGGEKPSEAFLDRLAETEAIDGHWLSELAALRAVLPGLTMPKDARYDRVLQYFLYRQLERAEDWGLDALVRYAQESTAFLAAQDAMAGFDPEHLRRYSEQIEYSTENVEILMK